VEPLARGFVMGNRTRDKQGETTRSKSDILPTSSTTPTWICHCRPGGRNRKSSRPLAGQSRAGLDAGKPYITSPIIGATKSRTSGGCAPSSEARRGECESPRKLYRPKSVMGCRGCGGAEAQRSRERRRHNERSVFHSCDRTRAALSGAEGFTPGVMQAVWRGSTRSTRGSTPT